MTRRGLPVGPPPPELIDLPLEPASEEPPFLRPRRSPRPKPRRRRLASHTLLTLQALAVGALAVLFAWFAWQRVFASDRLRVARLELRGYHFLSEGELRELVGPAVGENILTLDIQALKARLRASPWVADAVVTRTLPDILRVEIQERVPLALAELDRLYLMDAEGGLIDLYGPRTGAFDLPIVRGLVGVEEDSRRARARRAGLLLGDLAELGGEVSEVCVLPTGDLRLVLRGPGEVLLFAEPPYKQRLVTFLSLRKELAERAPDAEHFDLRFRGRIYAKRRTPAPVPLVEPAPARLDAVPRTPSRVPPSPATTEGARPAANPTKPALAERDAPGLAHLVSARRVALAAVPTGAALTPPVRD